MYFGKSSGPICSSAVKKVCSVSNSTPCAAKRDKNTFKELFGSPENDTDPNSRLENFAK